MGLIVESTYTTLAISDMALVLVPVREQNPSELLATTTALPVTEKSDLLIETFYFGRNEVTNADFACFLNSDAGREWQIERITKRGSEQQHEAPSAFRGYANEYYLSHWLLPDNGARYEPANATLRHPVVWVSWYSCAAFCNWLSSVEGRRQEYPDFPMGEPLKSELPGYRLPYVEEWYLATQGGYQAIRFPWEQYPFPMEDRVYFAAIDRLDLDQKIKDHLHAARTVAQKELLTQREGTGSVLEHAIGPYGTTSMGNVKEWTNSYILPGDKATSATGDKAKSTRGKSKGSRRQSKPTSTKVEGIPEDAMRVLMGATAQVGRANFSFEYWMALIGQNTNPDVGFRIARSLSEAEHEAVYGPDPTTSSRKQN